MFLSFLQLNFIYLILLFSQFAYGHLLFNFFSLKKLDLNQFISLKIILSLMLVGLIGISISFFSPINDIVVTIYSLFGLLLFLYLILKNNITKYDLLLIITVVIISSFISFYSLDNDDYHIHFRLIKVFKELGTIRNLIDHIPEGNRVSYNSHWLMIISMLSLKILPATLYFASSILYASILLDLLLIFKKNILKLNSYANAYAFFALVYILGVENSYKNIGTDLPGQLIMIIFSYYLLNTNFGKNSKYKIISFLFFFKFQFS